MLRFVLNEQTVSVDHDNNNNINNLTSRYFPLSFVPYNLRIEMPTNPGRIDFKI